MIEDSNELKRLRRIVRDYLDALDGGYDVLESHHLDEMRSEVAEENHADDQVAIP
jgi:hypothetical protein